MNRIKEIESDLNLKERRRNDRVFLKNFFYNSEILEEEGL